MLAVCLSVLEDGLTLAATAVFSSIAFSMRSIGFVLSRSPHVLPIFVRARREEEYGEIREESLLLRSEEEDVARAPTRSRRIKVEFAVPRAATTVGKAREIRFVDDENSRGAK